jgi:hypothetical protein
MEIAEKITLIASILWVIWSMLSLRNAVLEGGGIFPASITSVLLFIIGIVCYNPNFSFKVLYQILNK